MIKPLSLALALSTAFAAAAAAQDGFWSGAARLKCTIEVASTCDGTSCTPLNVARTVFVDLAGLRVCASNDGVNCAFQYYPITRSNQAGRLLLVVRGTGTSYSIAPDGRMSGASVVAPQTHTFLGSCEAG